MIGHEVILNILFYQSIYQTQQDKRITVNGGISRASIYLNVKVLDIGMVFAVYSLLNFGDTLIQGIDQRSCPLLLHLDCLQVWK